MTWMDVRDALKAGKTNIIISTGGIEPNGPWLVTGKHNYVLHANCEAIARKMGNALCAPIVKYVPEGDIETKTSHMASPGTISMREDTFRAVLRDTAESLQAHGFKNIIFIGDSGGNQAGQKAIAEELTAKWAGKALALHIAEYYDYASVAEYMKSHGIVDGKSDNMHDDPIITLNMFIDDPNSVRFNERVKAGKATINGVSVADKAKNTALAKQIVEFRATQDGGSDQQVDRREEAGDFFTAVALNCRLSIDDYDGRALKGSPVFFETEDRRGMRTDQLTGILEKSIRRADARRVRQGGFMLNHRDRGLLRSLERVPASEASR
jgi:creatinine amidohydrolase/Fe(II)-dependent formamide hydrolase-like protein